MFFRNLNLFRFGDDVAASLVDLEQHLAGQRLRRCGPLELATRGFVSPFGRDSDELVLRNGDFVLLAIGSEERMLPAVVVQEALAERLDKLAATEGRRPGARERKEMREQIVTELLPQAFIRPSRLLAYADLRDGWLVIDTASSKAAEDAVSLMRDALGSFPVAPLDADQAPRALMTDWLSNARLPANLELGDECELRDPAEAGAIVRCRRQDLTSEEVGEHLKSGKEVFQLGLDFAERLQFVLGEDLVVRKLRLSDVVTDELEDTPEDARAEVDARFALMSLELRNLLAALSDWFGLTAPGKGAGA